MADFFGFTQSTDFDHGLHDGPGDGLDDDADDYDALNDETFGADSMGGDWETGHEEMAEIAEKSRVHQLQEEHCNNILIETSAEDMGLEDLALEASLSQLVDDCDDNFISKKTKQKRGGITDRVIETGYSCSPPTEFNVWAVGEHDQVRQTNPNPPILTSMMKVHTLQELEQGLKKQSSPSIGPPMPLRLEDLERDLTRTGKLPFPPGFPRPVNKTMSAHVVQDRNSMNGVNPGDFPNIHIASPQIRNGPFGPILIPNQMQPGSMVDFRQHNRPHMGNMMRYMPPHPMMQQFHHHRNNMMFRMPNFPMGGHQMDPRSMQSFRRMPMPRHPGHPGHEEDHRRDEYDGLMSDREVQWLLNIQMLQINTGTPYQDDFYFTVFQSRKPQNRTDSRNGRSPRDNRPESSLGQQPRVYIPLQFENSLGKLQCGSVTAPRKIIDMDIVKDSIEPGAQQKDSRKVKRLLLQLEQLYLLLMQVEDQTNPLAAPHDPSVDRAALIERILITLTSDDRLQSSMCVRKGKSLILRLLPHVPVQNPLLNAVWCAIARHLGQIGRRDADGTLPRFYPYLRRWIDSSNLDQLTALAVSLRCPPSVAPAKGPLVAALGLEFGISSLSAILSRAALLVTDSPTADWVTFVAQLLCAASSFGAPVCTPVEPMRPETLTGFFEKFGNINAAGVTKLHSLLTCGAEDQARH